MLRDHRPYWLKKLMVRYEEWWARRWLRPNFTTMGDGFFIHFPWYVKVNGPNISLGEHSHMVAGPDRPIYFHTWVHGEHAGHISIGRYALISPNVRISSASSVTLGDGVMLANSVYISDADWHDLYDRNQIIGTTRPVVLEDNVWLGDSVTVNKGVTIGRNSIIGSCSNVVKDIPANVIAAGNPAVVIRPLDPERKVTGREAMFADFAGMQRDQDYLDHYTLDKNSLWGYLRHKFRPRPGD